MNGPTRRWNCGKETVAAEIRLGVVKKQKRQLAQYKCYLHCTKYFNKNSQTKTLAVASSIVFLLCVTDKSQLGSQMCLRHRFQSPPFPPGSTRTLHQSFKTKTGSEAFSNFSVLGLWICRLVLMGGANVSKRSGG